MKKSNWILLITALVMIGATARFLVYVKVNQKLGKPGVVVGNVPLFDPDTNRVAETRDLNMEAPTAGGSARPLLT